MYSNLQIHSLRTQIEKIKLQIDNIDTLNNSMNIKKMIDNPIDKQLYDLSIHLINAGIQAFNIGKDMNLNSNREIFYFQLQQISEQISLIISEKNIIQPEFLFKKQIEKEEMKNIKIIFENKDDTIKDKFINMTVKPKTKVKEVLNYYIYKMYGFPQDKMNFIFNGKRINRYEERLVEDFFRNTDTPHIKAFKLNVY